MRHRKNRAAFHKGRAGRRRFLRYDRRMKTILTPVDFSPASNRVIAHAAALARVFRARMVLLNVVQPPTVMSDYAPLMENIVEIVAVGEKAAVKRLAKLRAKLSEDMLTVETALARGSPIQAIIEAARKTAADYIVMGSHGHTALYDLVVGSTTHGVLKRAACPVVIVPPEKPSAIKRRARV
jgi:nucleotide-binding universal stress UspA family protein